MPHVLFVRSELFTYGHQLRGGGVEGWAPVVRVFARLRDAIDHVASPTGMPKPLARFDGVPDQLVGPEERQRVIDLALAQFGGAFQVTMEQLRTLGVHRREWALQTRYEEGCDILRAAGLAATLKKDSSSGWWNLRVATEYGEVVFTWRGQTQGGWSAHMEGLPYGTSSSRLNPVEVYQSIIQVYHDTKAILDEMRLAPKVIMDGKAYSDLRDRPVSWGGWYSVVQRHAGFPSVRYYHEKPDFRNDQMRWEGLALGDGSDVVIRGRHVVRVE